MEKKIDVQKKSDVQMLIDHYGDKQKVADILEITVRHVENCLKGKHIGKPLAKLMKSYVAMLVG